MYHSVIIPEKMRNAVVAQVMCNHSFDQSGMTKKLTF